MSCEVSKEGVLIDRYLQDRLKAEILAEFFDSNYHGTYALAVEYERGIKAAEGKRGNKKKTEKETEARKQG